MAGYLENYRLIWWKQKGAGFYLGKVQFRRSEQKLYVCSFTLIQ